MGPLIDQIRRQLTCQAGLLDGSDAIRLIDSAPISVATYGRGRINQTLCGAEYIGIASSHGAKVFGLRLTITTTPDQMLARWMLAPAARHDSTTLADALAETTNCLVLADGAYRNPFTQNLLSAKQGVKLLARPRQDSTQPWPAAARRLLNRLRRNI